MQKFKEVWQKYDLSFWVGSVVVALVAWLANRMVKLPHIRRSQMVLLSWLLINGCFAIWVGMHVKQKFDHWWKLFVFPVLYGLVAFFFMPRYSLYLAPAYLALSYLAWAMTNNGSEESQSPVLPTNKQSHN